MFRDSVKGRAQLKPDGTLWHTVGEVKGKHASGVGRQVLRSTSEHGVSSITTITTADAHTSAASSRLNWLPCQFKWTRPFSWKTKSGFCACAITFQTWCTCWPLLSPVSPSLPLLCVTLCHQISTGVYLKLNPYRHRRVQYLCSRGSYR